MAMSIKFGDNESYYYDCGFCRCFLFLLYAIVYTNMYFFTSLFDLVRPPYVVQDLIGKRLRRAYAG